MNVAFDVGRMTADAAAGADASEDASSADGFSGETDRFREDCGLPRAFLKNWTVGFGAVEPEASASDIMSSGRRYSKTGRAQDGKQAMGNASRTQEPFASIANPHLGSRFASRRLLDRHACSLS